MPDQLFASGNLVGRGDGILEVDDDGIAGKRAILASALSFEAGI